MDEDISNYISILEEKGFIVFDNIVELKKVVLQTATEDELIRELIIRKTNNDDCGCNK